MSDEARTLPMTESLTPEQIAVVNDMIHAWLDPDKNGEFREAFRNDCKRLLATGHDKARTSPASAHEDGTFTGVVIKRAGVLIDTADKSSRGKWKPARC